MFGEPEICCVCTSRIPDHCREKSEGFEGGRKIITCRVYCPACDTGFELTYGDIGGGSYVPVGGSRLQEGDHALGHLRLRHEEMTDRAFALAS